jgi:hypothetical protein
VQPQDVSSRPVPPTVCHPRTEERSRIHRTTHRPSPQARYACARDGTGNRSSLPQDDVDGQYVGESFKALKQTAKVKSFLGTSANAVKTQIWTALIAMLILKYLQMKSSFGWSLSNLAALLRQQLFIFRDLWAWLNDPLEGPPAARQLAEQLPMPLIW